MQIQHAHINFDQVGFQGFGVDFLNSGQLFRRDEVGAVLFVHLERWRSIETGVSIDVREEFLFGVIERLHQAVRKHPVLRKNEKRSVVRVGRDDFMLVLREPSLPVADATDVAIRLLRAFEQPLSARGINLRMGLRIGVAVTEAGRSTTIEELLRDAQIAAVQPDESSRRGFTVFSPAMRVAAVERINIEHDLGKAIDRGDLELHYQPIVSLATGQVEGLEALARWRRNGRQVCPAEFIAIAEETDAICRLGAWAIDEASRQMAEWIRQIPDMPSLHVSVNVSGKQLASRDLVDQVKAAIATHAISPSCLQLEVTETIAMHDIPLTSKLLGELRELQVGLALDDFGVGYSSLSCLRSLPFNVLKIDRSFLTANPRQSADKKMIRSIVGLAHAYNLDVTAEGVETPVDMAMLRDAGCQHGQGYAFAAPLPPTFAKQWLEHNLEQQLVAVA